MAYFISQISLNLGYLYVCQLAAIHWWRLHQWSVVLGPWSKKALYSSSVYFFERQYNFWNCVCTQLTPFSSIMVKNQFNKYLIQERIHINIGWLESIELWIQSWTKIDNCWGLLNQYLSLNSLWIILVPASSYIFF